MNSMFISYEESQAVTPILSWLEEKAPLIEARKSAARILWELRSVREDVSYEPFKGYQLFLGTTDLAFLTDIMEQLGLR